jgi:hypothetical protein
MVRINIRQGILYLNINWTIYYELRGRRTTVFPYDLYIVGLEFN